MPKIPENIKPEPKKPEDKKSDEKKAPTIETVVNLVNKQQLSLFTPYRTISLLGKILFIGMFIWILVSISSVNHSILELNKRVSRYEQKLQDKTTGLEIDLALIKRFIYDLKTVTE